MVLGLVELGYRLAHQPTEESVAFRFYTALNRWRWKFLRMHRDELLTICWPHKPNSEWIQAPAKSAPPYDRIMIPIHEAMNAMGFRDGPFEPGKEPGRRRILILGDSTGFGYGIVEEERFSSVMRAAAPEHVEVWNLALRGCTSETLRLLFEEFGDVSPDLVVIQTPANDYDQVLWRISGHDEPSLVNHLVLELLHRSFLAQRISRTLFGNPYRHQLEDTSAHAAHFYGDDMDALIDLVKQRGAKAVVLSLIRADGPRHGEHMSMRCRARPDVCLGVLDVDFDDLAGWIPDALPPETGDDPRGYPWLRESAKDLGVPYELLARVIPYHALFHDIIHPNPRGHLLIGRQLTAFLRAHWEGFESPAEETP